MHSSGELAMPSTNPKELGWVRWERDFDRASARAAEEGKPIFALFQEVPGCSTCVGFGESVLSHPLLIEAIETEFVPVAIFNNERSERAVLERFNEPSWNNPVVRLLDKSGNDLLPRKDGVWSTLAIAQRTRAALQRAKRPVPDYLQWVIDEATPHQDRATFAMHCYWSGEACLGDIEGVVSTSAGWKDRREVVEVDFDDTIISATELRARAERAGCGEFVTTPGRARTAKDADRKYHLRRSGWRFVPLTPRQASRVNSALARNADPMPHVSPRQRAIYQRIERTLAGQPSKLDGLQAPVAIDELAAYQATLERQLQ
jgi:hypothetical protein